MGIVIEDVNSLSPFLLLDASEEYQRKIKQVAVYAWDIIKHRKDEILSLSCVDDLCVQRDRKGYPVRVIPIEENVRKNIGISKEENISLAIIESYFLLGDSENIEIPPCNVYCLLLNIGELMSEMIAMMAIERSFEVAYKERDNFHNSFLNNFLFPTMQFLNEKKSSDEIKQLDEYRTIREERNNFIVIEIGEVVKLLLDQGEQPKPANVWRMLKSRVGRDDSCCKFLGSDPTPTGNGEAIFWFDANGLRKHLTYKNLTERLRQEKIKRIIKNHANHTINQQ